MEKSKNGTFYKMSDNCKQLAIVKNQNDKNVIVCGEYQISQEEFETIEEAERFIKSIHYNEMFALFYVLNKYYNEKGKEAPMPNMEEKNARS